MEESKDFLADIGADPAPHLYRIFKSTVQRVPPLIASLNSHATFLMLLEQSRRIVGWVGHNCGKNDITLMKELAQEIFLRDFGDKSLPSFPIITEGQEPAELLEKFLDALWSGPTAYHARLAMAERRTIIHNSPVSVGTLAMSKQGDDKFEILESAFAHPDANGAVPRVTFAHIEQASIVYVNIGDQWDLWFARGVQQQQRSDAAAFIRAFIETQAINAAEDYNTLNHEALELYLVTVEQGDETVMFRRPIKIFTDFEPPGRSLPRTPRAQVTVPVRSNSGESKAPSLQDLPRQSGGSELALQLDDIAFVHSTEDVDQADRVDFWKDVSGVKEKQHAAAPESHQGTYQATPARLDIASGAFAINAAMLDMVEAENISLDRRRLLTEEASFNPSALVGWQVEVDEGLFKGIFVVVGFKKSPIFRKSFFHLAALHGDEFWVRLKRSDKKRGVKFRPLRQVAVLQ